MGKRAQLCRADRPRDASFARGLGPRVIESLGTRRAACVRSTISQRIPPRNTWSRASARVDVRWLAVFAWRVERRRCDQRLVSQHPALGKRGSGELAEFARPQRLCPALLNYACASSDRHLRYRLSVPCVPARAMSCAAAALLASSVVVPSHGRPSYATYAARLRCHSQHAERGPAPTQGIAQELPQSKARAQSYLPLLRAILDSALSRQLAPEMRQTCVASH